MDPIQNIFVKMIPTPPPIYEYFVSIMHIAKFNCNKIRYKYIVSSVYSLICISQYMRITIFKIHLHFNLIIASLSFNEFMLRCEHNVPLIIYYIDYYFSCIHFVAHSIVSMLPETHQSCQYFSNQPI